MEQALKRPRWIGSMTDEDAAKALRAILYSKRGMLVTFDDLLEQGRWELCVSVKPIEETGKPND